MMNPAHLRAMLLSLLFSIAVGATNASAQQAIPPAATGKTFDVVSIR